MSVSAALTTVSVTARQIVRPGESVTASLTVAAAETFSGIAALQVSKDGLAWPDIVSQAGVRQRVDGTAVGLTAGVATSVVFTNETPNAVYLRGAVLDAGGDDGITVDLIEATGEALEVLLADSKGNPVLVLLPNRGVQVLAGLTVLGATALQAATVAGSLAPTGGIAVSGVTNVTEHVDELTISAAAIIATGAGNFGHAAGFPLVAAPGADVACELVSALVVNDRDTAAYTAGGNTTVNLAGGAAVTGLVAAAAFLGAAADTIHLFKPLAAVGNVLTANLGLNLVTSAAFTNPGTAAGVVRVRIRYRLHTLGLA